MNMGVLASFFGRFRPKIRKLDFTYICLDFIEGKICVAKWGLSKPNGGFIEIGLEHVIPDDDVETLAAIIEKRKNEHAPEVNDGCKVEESTYFKMGYKTWGQFSRNNAVCALIIYQAKTEIYAAPRGSKPGTQDKYEIETTDPRQIADWVMLHKNMLNLK